MCIARPLLNDERLSELARGLDALPEDVTGLDVDLGAALTGAIDTASVPVRVVVGQFVINRIDATIADADITWVPDRSPAFEGSGVLRIDLTPEDGSVMVHGFREARVFDDIRLRINVATVRVELRPVVNHHSDRNELRFRALSPQLLNNRGRFIGPGNVEVLDPGRFKVLDRIFRRRGSVDPADVAGVSVLGGVAQGVAALIRPVLDEALVGGLLFGVPDATQHPVRARPPAVLEAAASSSGALDVRYRGERVNFTEVAGRDMETLETDVFCCALPERSPDCMECIAFPERGLSCPQRTSAECSRNDCPLTPFAQCVDWETEARGEGGAACFR